MAKKEKKEKIIKDNNALKIKKKKTDLDKFNEKHVNVKNISDKKGLSDTVKILIITVLLLIVIALTLFIYQSQTNNNKDDVIISEESFLNDIYKVLDNYESYIGKTIVFQGIYSTYEVDGKLYKMVYRKTPGTSGNNGMAAFDLSYTGDVELNDNDYVKVTGVLDKYIDDLDNEEYLIIKASKVEKINELNEFVYK